MSVQVKICGLNDTAAVVAASEGGARYGGFVFYPKSPRVVDAETAAYLVALLSPLVTPVGLFVNPTNEDIDSVLDFVPLQAIQLHGSETPERVAELKQKVGLTIIKAIGIATAQDIFDVQKYESVADILLLDSKPAPDAALPGGNAQTFDWDILKNVRLTKPWMLAGGLTPDNLADAVRRSCARLLDVSSGVEDAPGHKNPAKIRAFLEGAARIETSY